VGGAKGERALAGLGLDADPPASPAERPRRRVPLAEAVGEEPSVGTSPGRWLVHPARYTQCWAGQFRSFAGCRLDLLKPAVYSPSGTSRFSVALTQRSGVSRWWALNSVIWAGPRLAKRARRSPLSSAWGLAPTISAATDLPTAGAS
jgi:hypothetical protein